jgi:hypothetical protein
MLALGAFLPRSDRPDVRASRGQAGHAGGVITRGAFIDRLEAEVPEATSVVAEHLADNDGELLVHLLFSDLLRLTVSNFHNGQLGVTDRLLAFVDRCLREGDDYIINAVSVSFVEHFGALPGETDELLDRWPTGLHQELGR